MPPAGSSRTPLTQLINTIPQYQQRVVFGTTDVFSPGVPLQPTSREPTRIFDFRVGENMFWTPRSGEAWSFQQLRNLVEPGAFDIARLAIETRKDQVERLDFTVRPIEASKRKGAKDARIDAVLKLAARPDGMRDNAAWTRRLLEDLFVIDAPAVEVRRNRGGEIIGLDVIDGATFKPLIDDTGRTPLPPAPAYEQVIKGRPWALLTTDELIYRPRNQRAHRIYGFSPVEQILTTIHIGLSRQLSQLNYFTDGTTPPGFLNAPEGWSPDQVKEYYDDLAAILSGNLDARRRGWIAPAGARWQAVKDSPLKDEFDEWIARVVCYAFSLPPTPFIRQLNRSSAQTSDETALEEGLEPIKSYLKRWWDDVIQLRLGYDDLEFAWVDDKTIDPKDQADIDDTMLRNASANINEVRKRHGLDPIPNGDCYLIYTASGAVSLDTIVGETGDQIAPPPGTPSEPETPPGDGKPRKTAPEGAPEPPESEPPETEKLLKLLKAGPGLIDPEDAVPVDLPIADQFTRAHVDHLAWVWVQGGNALPAPVSVPIDRIWATQDIVDRRRVAKHAEHFRRHGGYDRAPVTLELQGLYYILDGHHHVEGAKLAGAQELDVVAIPADSDTLPDAPDFAALLTEIEPLAA